MSKQTSPEVARQVGKKRGVPPVAGSARAAMQSPRRKVKVKTREQVTKEILKELIS